MTARAAWGVCRSHGYDPELDADSGRPKEIGKASCGKEGPCPCPEFKQAAVVPSLPIRLAGFLSFRKDTSAACIGCWYDGEQTDEHGNIFRSCDLCSNRKSKLRMESAIEAMGGVMA